MGKDICKDREQGRRSFSARGQLAVVAFVGQKVPGETTRCLRRCAGCQQTRCTKAARRLEFGAVVGEGAGQTRALLQKYVWPERGTVEGEGLGRLEPWEMGLEVGPQGICAVGGAAGCRGPGPGARDRCPWAAGGPRRCSLTPQLDSSFLPSGWVLWPRERSFQRWRVANT